MRVFAGAGVAALVLLVGCGGGGSSQPKDSSDAKVCAAALSEADAGFTALSQQIRQVQAAMDMAFAGDMAGARQRLAYARSVGRSATVYKRLEAQCREAVAP